MYEILTKQKHAHDGLAELWARRENKAWLCDDNRQLAIFKRLFDELNQFQGEKILDSGCGTAESSLYLAERFPESLILGCDKSEARLEKNLIYSENVNDNIAKHENLILERCDIFHFWHFAARHDLHFDKHYMLYPNPWPKLPHLNRRYHGHPSFISALDISSRVIMRTNWKIYADEFAKVISLLKSKTVVVSDFDITDPMSAFERKYKVTKTPVWEVNVGLI